MLCFVEMQRKLAMFLHGSKNGSQIRTAYIGHGVYQRNMNSFTFDEDLDKANAFNKYFYSVFSHSSHTPPDISNLPFVSNSVSDLTISLDEVHQALTSLQPESIWSR